MTLKQAEAWRAVLRAAYDALALMVEEHDELGTVPHLITPEVYEIAERERDKLLAEQLTPKTKPEPPNAETYNCPYCKRVLPASIEEAHSANCRADSQGYFTHTSRPGER